MLFLQPRCSYLFDIRIRYKLYVIALIKLIIDQTVLQLLILSVFLIGRRAIVMMGFLATVSFNSFNPR